MRRLGPQAADQAVQWGYGVNHHAFSRRNLYGRWLVAAALGGLSLTVHAAYSSVTPPTAVQGGPGAYAVKMGADTVIRRASDSSRAFVRASASLNLGTKRQAIPILARVTTGAPAAAARFMFMNPIGLGVTAVAFLASEYITYEDGTFLFADPNAVTYPVSDGMKFCASWSCNTDKVLACKGYQGANYWKVTEYSGYQTPWQCFSVYNSYVNITQQANPSCPAGWYITPGGCVQTAPPTQVALDEEDFVEKVAPKLPPEKIPEYVPSLPVPVEDPMLLPDNDENDDAAVPRPLYIPVGDPVPVPNTDPPTYSQPMTRITPSPTPSDPWRVDVQPYNRVSESPEGVNEPTQDPTGTGTGTTTAPNTDSDLCAKYPNIDACRETEYDTPDGEIPTDEISASYSVDNFLSGGGSCPADVYVTTRAGTVKAINMVEACGYVTSYVRPLVLVVCAFAAVMIVAGGFKV